MDVGLAAGVWGVVATPFHGDRLEIDRESLARLASHYASCGVSGLTVLGVFGEAVRLTTAERRHVLETVAEAVELPLVVGTTSSATAPVIEEIELIQSVVGARLAGAMVQVNTGDPAMLAAHLRAVHTGTGAPIVVQDYPVATGVKITTPALISALDGLPGVAAIKAEAPPTPLAVSALTTALGVPVFGGIGGIGLLDELAAGAAGAMTGFSFPEGLVAATTAWRTGGYAAAREAFLPYLPLVNFEQQAGPALAIRKRCLQSRGLFADAAVRPPAPGMPPALEEQLARHLAALAGV
ncbi:dihydrodipicolinate synthase family protein [Nonomuraea insulae]|uniref:Dihydrodipicolinate synthase family protein n=1 Tax=Nonomuraea insulae TaxID=1616787 RepID=A0ABW1D9R9_9ACTN